jgi:DNA-binding transcriptional MerR regulator
MSLETGISKEVLRKWEERYGFPVPDRDASGHRSYAQQQTARLKLIKRLIDSGMRPANVVPLSEAELQTLLRAHSDTAPAPNVDTLLVADLMAVLRARDLAALTQRLRWELDRLGLENFVLSVMAALNSEIGAAWERGEIAIRDEHMYSEAIQRLLREQLALAGQTDGAPRVLFTTPSGESHTLGILMAEALLSQYGACCISLGAEMPVEEIVHGIDDYRADIVCLCFSAAFPKRRIAPWLKTLRGLVPDAVEIWVGGAGVIALEPSPRGVKIMPVLQHLKEALSKYRRSRSSMLARQQ